MNRKHTAADYRRLIDRLRDARPDLALSSDFIVGFPGETDADFEATMALIRDIGFAQAFSFKYSRRPGTPGAAMPKQIAEAVKDARLKELQDELVRQQVAFNAWAHRCAHPGPSTARPPSRPGRRPLALASRPCMWTATWT